MKTQQSESLYAEATRYFPGGVNSPVRAFRSVGGTPLFIESGDGCRITDADGNSYIDFCASWGPLILGHNASPVREAIVSAVSKGTSFGAPTRGENELASLVLSNNPYIEKIRFVSSGTEAVMSALRLARAVTGKNRIVKFDGCYHGHVDSMLVKAGSGLSTFGIASSAGVPENVSCDTVVLPLDDKEALEDLFRREGDSLAAVIIEPVPANHGLLVQEKEFLSFLRDITERHGVLLIFDEVITGFRLGLAGATGYYGIRPDIITYGKIIGGGMPVGAYGSTAERMKRIAPEGNVYQAGTLSGNPVAMAAGKAQLEACAKPGFYESLREKTEYFIGTFQKLRNGRSQDFRIVTLGSMFWPVFSMRNPIRKATDVDAGGMELFRKWYASLLRRGVYLGPSGYEVGFISAAHRHEDLEEAAGIFAEALEDVFAEKTV